MYRFILKGCRRCGGDLAFDQDRWGPFWFCLFCARYLLPGDLHYPISVRVPTPSGLAFHP